MKWWLISFGQCMTRWYATWYVHARTLVTVHAELSRRVRMSHCCLHRKLHLGGRAVNVQKPTWCTLYTWVMWWQVPWCCGALICRPVARLCGHLLRSPGSRGRLCAGSRGSWSAGAEWRVFLSRSGQKDHRTGAQRNRVGYRVCDWTANPSPFPYRRHTRSGPQLSVPSGHFEVQCSPCGGWSCSAWSHRASLGPTGQSQSPRTGPFWGLRSFEADPPKKSVSHCADSCIWYAGAWLMRGRKFCLHTHPSHSQFPRLFWWWQWSDTWAPKVLSVIKFRTDLLACNQRAATAEKNQIKKS